MFFEDLIFKENGVGYEFGSSILCFIVFEWIARGIRVKLIVMSMGCKIILSVGYVVVLVFWFFYNIMEYWKVSLFLFVVISVNITGLEFGEIFISIGDESI